jgi:hypothetical protein
LEDLVIGLEAENHCRSELLNARVLVTARNASAIVGSFQLNQDLLNSNLQNKVRTTTILKNKQTIGGHLRRHEMLQPGSAKAVANNLKANVSNVGQNEDNVRVRHISHLQLFEIGQVSNQQPESGNACEVLNGIFCAAQKAGNREAVEC